MTTAQEGGNIVSLTHRPHLPPGYSPGTHFCLRLSRPHGHSAIGKIMSMKNSNDTIWDRTSDLRRTYILLFLLLLYSCLCKFSGFLSGTAAMLCSITGRLLQNVSTLSSDPTFQGPMSNERPGNEHPVTDSNITEANVLGFCSCLVCFM